MLRFLAGILLVQVASVLLVLVSAPSSMDWASWLPIGVALAVIALVTAFWFANLASHQRRDEVQRLQSDFARERDRLRVKAERDKTKLIKQSQKTVVSETRRAEARANFKIGIAVAAAAGAGLLMVLANFMTLGLLLMTAAGGALGGYLLRRDWAARLPGLRKSGESLREPAGKGADNSPVRPPAQLPGKRSLF